MIMVETEKMIDDPAEFNVWVESRILNAGRVSKDTGVRFKFKIRISRSERY